MNDLVDEIAKKKAELTKGHLQCFLRFKIFSQRAENEVGEIIWSK